METTSGLLLSPSLFGGAAIHMLIVDGWSNGLIALISTTTATSFEKIRILAKVLKSKLSKDITLCCNIQF